MLSGYSSGNKLSDMNLTQYFMESVSSAVYRQRVVAEDETVFYLVNLLTNAVRTERLFKETPEGLVKQPLALLYAEAVQAPTLASRQNALQRLGDLALLISGLFADSLQRKVVDIDYYVAMGCSAYGFLSELTFGTARGRVFRAIFAELSLKFQAFVDVLAEVGENAHLASQVDVMRLYETWLVTGSPRIAERLRKMGIEPCQGSLSRRQN